MKPILFSSPMMRAILDGTKTQTRRVAKARTSCPYVEYKAEEDILWCRETWSLKENGGYYYRADYPENRCPEGIKWKPSILMPKVACRVRLRILNVRMERLHDITEQDAIAEGIQQISHGLYQDYLGERQLTPVESFKSLWISINGLASWDENPYVWAIRFEEIMAGVYGY